MKKPKVDLSKLPLWLLKNFYILIPAIITVALRIAEVNESDPVKQTNLTVAKEIMIYVTIAAIVSWMVIQGIRAYRTWNEMDEAEK